MVLCGQGTSRPHVISSCRRHEVENNRELHVECFINLLDYICRPKSQSPSLARKEELGNRGNYFGYEEWPFGGNGECKSQCLRGVENLNLTPALLSERSGLVGSRGHRSLWKKSVREQQCHYPSLILRQKLTQRLMPDIDERVQISRGMELTKHRGQGRHCSSEGGYLRHPGRCEGRTYNYQSSQAPSFRIGNLSQSLGWPHKRQTAILLL